MIHKEMGTQSLLASQIPNGKRLSDLLYSKILVIMKKINLFESYAKPSE